MDIDKSIKIAFKIVSMFEGCNLRSYPDPASPLYKALSQRNLLKLYMAGKAEIPEDLESLDGTPFTIGHGQTKGVQRGDIWTQHQADDDLMNTLRGVANEVLAVSPNLSKHSEDKLAAVVSFTYNCGIGNYSHSTVCKMIAAENMQEAANSFMLWTKSHGAVMDGLVKRRTVEKNLFLSVQG